MLSFIQLIFIRLNYFVMLFLELYYYNILLLYLPGYIITAVYYSHIYTSELLRLSLHTVIRAVSYPPQYY